MTATAKTNQKALQALNKLSRTGSAYKRWKSIFEISGRAVQRVNPNYTYALQLDNMETDEEMDKIWEKGLTF